ncbi:MAG: glycosyl hydrolase family protein [Planctomycetota bacterium]|nr:MAG: glycosyl hydrolase family protein [Planctomycetota bacterium]
MIRSASNMQRHRALAFASLIVAFAASPDARAALQNGGFEQSGGSLNPWVVFNNVAGNVSVDTTTPRSGSYVARISGGNNGSPNYSGIFQNVSAISGQTWEARGFVRHNAGDSLIATSNRLVLKIEFYNTINGTYGTSDLIGESAVDVLDATTPTDTWHEVAIQATAPAGTVEARIALVFEQIGGASGTALVDDVTFGVTNGGWTLIWSDEFDGPSLDGNKWRVEDLHLIKNAELQYYAPDDVYLQNGNLVLRSQQRTYWGYDENGAWRQFDYTSGLVDTRDRFAFTYGRVEVRAKLPSTQGIWPAHWMLPDSRQWPPEIDIMELLGHEPTRVYMTHHWGTWPNVQSDGGSYSGPDFSAGFHTFAIEWLPDRILWYVDDVLRFSSTISIPQEPFFLTLNTAVGGNWPGNPDGTTVFPQYHEIDYVRVYALGGAGDGVLNVTDVTESGAATDGMIGVGEYELEASGINSGFGDLIGSTSSMYVDSDADMLHIGFQSAAPWTTPYGVVVYIDSRAGGFASTVQLADVADRPRRLASGKGQSGERADLYFAPGFLADFAITFEPGRVRVFELSAASHNLLNGAAVNATTDLLGGADVRYVDDGANVRELRLPLSLMGLSPGETIRFVATLLNGNSAFRSDEFIGVAPGNAFDGANIGQTAAVLKTGDFIRFDTFAASVCGAGCETLGGDADVTNDCTVDLTDLAVLLSNYGLTNGALHEQGDTDRDGDIDLTDLAQLLSRFEATCP